MKTLLTILSVILAATLLTASAGWCHGVEGRVDSTGGYCVTALYDDGEPMSYAAVEVKAPQSDIAFQTGRTDRNGCFMVNADVPGAWQAIVSDGMGHRLALDFTVAAEGQADATGQPPATPPASQKMPRPLTALAGLAIIFGLCGFIYGWKARRLKADVDSALP